MRLRGSLFQALAFAFIFVAFPASVPAERPNILWIVVEDASAHIGCYGETTIQTPHIDSLAREGVRFTDAIVTSPVCSPSRSAMITGMYQTTLGAHQHRSQRREGKGGGNEPYYDSFYLPVKSLPELFREAGYYVTNSGRSDKEDYNFEVRHPLYDEGDWTNRPHLSQPFFSQVQLDGGKIRDAVVDNPVNPANINLPPVYPDHPVLRQDWAEYLNSWILTDIEVGEILDQLRESGEIDNTVIFFWTDHGFLHVRGKQFLYEEGIHVPLIVRFPDGSHAGTTREDLVEHIDIAAASLALAGITIPDYVQGRPLFAKDHQPREYAFSARDRCDETVDIIRAVRTKRWKYIRNFLSYLPHTQPNQHKDSKANLQTMRQLYAEGKLNELQARPFVTPRPVEELYDLENDPFETVNLASDSAHAGRVAGLRTVLYQWMEDTRDPGLIPEPILEELGGAHGSKYAAMQLPEYKQLIPSLIHLIEAGEKGDLEALRDALDSEAASLRYWALTWLGVNEDRTSLERIRDGMSDESPAVRIAAALALCRIGFADEGAPLLAGHINDPNLITGLYAIRGLELIGPDARDQLPAIVAARQSRYDFISRIARRIEANLTSE